MQQFKFIGGIILTAVVLFLVIRYGRPPQMEQPVPLSPVPQESRELCYIWNTEAGDHATLRMTFTGTGGSVVAGSFDFNPAEKDRKRGPFEGTAGPVDPKAMARTAHLWWHASAEGMTNTEELSVIFGDGTAGVGFGEMKDRGDGTYVYASPDKLSYEPTLQQTDCGDPAVK